MPALVGRLGYCDVWFWGELVNVLSPLTALHAILVLKFVQLWLIFISFLILNSLKVKGLHGNVTHYFDSPNYLTCFVLI